MLLHRRVWGKWMSFGGVVCDGNLRSAQLGSLNGNLCPGQHPAIAPCKVVSSTPHLPPPPFASKDSPLQSNVEALEGLLGCCIDVSFQPWDHGNAPTTQTKVVTQNHRTASFVHGDIISFSRVIGKREQDPIFVSTKTVAAWCKYGKLCAGGLRMCRWI